MRPRRSCPWVASGFAETRESSFPLGERLDGEEEEKRTSSVHELKRKESRVETRRKDGLLRGEVDGI